MRGFTVERGTRSSCVIPLVLSVHLVKTDTGRDSTVAGVIAK